MCEYQRPVEDGSMSVSKSTKLGYGLLAVGGGRGQELSGPGPCFCYLVLSALAKFIETSLHAGSKRRAGPPQV